MKFDKILVSGCSFANGSGLPGEHSNPRIWPIQLANKLQSKELNNVSKSGANNHWIFLETVSELIKNEYDLVLVQWSAIPRYKFKVGLELYTVDSMLDRDINLVGKQTVSKKWLSEIKERLLRIHNDHWDILDLVKYVNVLIEIQVQCRKKQIFFVNGLGPWSDQYFVKKQIQLPGDLDSYTYNLLQVDQRDDDEVFQLYDMIHDHYQQFGGIQEQHWLNLYQSQMSTKIDTVSREDRHPGYQSQDVFAEEYYCKILEKTKHQ